MANENLDILCSECVSPGFTAFATTEKGGITMTTSSHRAYKSWSSSYVNFIVSFGSTTILKTKISFNKWELTLEGRWC